MTERLVTRRSRLAPFCQVEAVKQHLRLQSYFQLARQLYRQSEIYFAERDFDNACVVCPLRRMLSSLYLVTDAVGRGGCLTRVPVATCSSPSSSSAYPPGLKCGEI